MALLHFSCSDRNDNPVDCTVERWEHIIGERPIMEGRENVVKAVLLDPDVITQGQNGRQCWYRYGIHPAARTSFVKVVVRYQPQLDWERGHITTAFVADKLNPGEPAIWRK